MNILPRGHRYELDPSKRSEDPKHKIKFVKLRTKTPTLVQVVDDEYNVVQVLDEAEHGCHGAQAMYFGLCGGCDPCLLMQAHHYGYSIEPYRWWRKYVPAVREIGTWMLTALWAGVLVALQLIYSR